MIQPLLQTMSGSLFSLGHSLGQLKPSALQGDPAQLPEGSSVMTMIMGAIIVIGVVAIAFRPAKRDRMDK